MYLKRIAILGAGNGGITAAADLGSRGFSVSLYELPRFAHNLEPVVRRGGILLKTKEGDRLVTPDLITTDITEALAGARVVMLVVPSTAVEEMAVLCAPCLRDGQIVFLNGAAAMGSLRFIRTARAHGATADYRIGESASLTYACRVNQNAEAELILRVGKVKFAALPAQDTPELLAVCRELYDCLIPAANVWEVCLNNGNPESHCGPSLLNAGRIEYSKGEFYLYTEGITPTVINVIEAVARERKAICRALGLSFVPPEVRLVELGYCEPAASLFDQYQQSTIFAPIKGPLNLSSRYFTEDIPMGLVLWASLGRALSVPTPVMDSIITLGGALLGRDYREEGITLQKLGLEGLNALELTEMVTGRADSSFYKGSE